MSANTEIRNLKEGTLDNLIQILHFVEDDWKKFMSLIPMDPQKENSERKYNSEHISLIENHVKENNNEIKCAKILFDEWGTSGEIRPTLRTVQQIALEAEMIRLADAIADMLQEPRPPRPTRGPGAPVDGDVSALLNETSSEAVRDTTKQMRSENKGTNNEIQNQTTEPMLNQPNWDKLLLTCSSSQSSYQQSLPIMSIFQNSHPMENPSLSSRVDTSILRDANLAHFNYSELEALTDNFSNTHKIGAGGFGDVYRAQTADGLLAIKKTRLQQNQEDVMRIFNSEVKYLSQFRHEHIVPILGICISPVPCIVCEYIEGGSLFDKLAERVLSEEQRLGVMRGTAEGLRYLHSNCADAADYSDPVHSVSKTNFVHGDVKSANILLTKDCVPKLCDFGLAKQYEHTFIQPTVIGTKVYMAPEALSGSVTQKSDIYSYGVVVLELLTALRPRMRAPDGADIDIKLYLHEGMRAGRGLAHFLDGSARWTRAPELFTLACQCLVTDRNDRPTSELICLILASLQNK